MTFLALEHFKWPTKKEFGITVVAAAITIILWHIISLFSISHSTESLLQITILLLITNLTVYLIKRVGPIITINLLVALATWNLDLLFLSSSSKLLLLIAIAIIMDSIYLIFKIEVNQVAVDLLAGSTIAAALMPAIAILLKDPNLIIDFSQSTLNFTIILAAVGFLTSSLASVMWVYLKTTKVVVKIESNLQKLA